MKRSYLIFFVAILASSFSLAQTPIENELLSFVIGIEGKTHLGRNEFIKDQLRTLGVGYVTAPFSHMTVIKKDTTVTKGENIVVRVGAGTKLRVPMTMAAALLFYFLSLNNFQIRCGITPWIFVSSIRKRQDSSDHIIISNSLSSLSVILR
jgi:hypothetical protein